MSRGDEGKSSLRFGSDGFVVWSGTLLVQQDQASQTLHC